MWYNNHLLYAGILAAERQLLQQQQQTSATAQLASFAPTTAAANVPATPQQQQMSSTTSSFVLSTCSSLDLVSCLHFLLDDLFQHWLHDGPDAMPLPLLADTVQTVSAAAGH